MLSKVISLECGYTSHLHDCAIHLGGWDAYADSVCTCLTGYHNGREVIHEEVLMFKCMQLRNSFLQRLVSRVFQHVLAAPTGRLGGEGSRMCERSWQRFLPLPSAPPSPLRLTERAWGTPNKRGPKISTWSGKLEHLTNVLNTLLILVKTQEPSVRLLGMTAYDNGALYPCSQHKIIVGFNAHYVELMPVHAVEWSHGPFCTHAFHAPFRDATVLTDEKSLALTPSWDPNFWTEEIQTEAYPESTYRRHWHCVRQWLSPRHVRKIVPFHWRMPPTPHRGSWRAQRSRNKDPRLSHATSVRR